VDLRLYLLIALLPAQVVPGNGWGLVPGVGQVNNLYYELFDTTAIWVHLIPEDPAGKPSLHSLIFKAFFPGRLPHRTGDERILEAKRPPTQLLLQAQAGRLTVVRERPTLWFVIDGTTVELTVSWARYLYPSGVRSRYFYPCFGCAATGVEVDLAPSILHSLITAQSVTGHALDFPMKLTPEDQQALAQFEARIGLAQEKKRDP